MDNDKSIQYPVPLSWFRKNAGWVATTLTIIGIIGGVILDRYLIQEKILLEVEYIHKDIGQIENNVGRLENLFQTRVKLRDVITSSDSGIIE
jgi:hypothetical protein